MEDNDTIEVYQEQVIFIRLIHWKIDSSFPLGWRLRSDQFLKHNKKYSSIFEFQ